MAGTKQARQKANERRRRAAALAAEAARRRAVRRRWAMAVGAVVAIGLIVLIIALVAGDDDPAQDVASSSSTTSLTGTTEAAAGSAAGKPCVAAQPGPEGAPEVPVATGPPPTELVKEDLEAGDGAEVTPGATVKVDYIGVACSTGKVFDSSYDGDPVEFSLNGVIKGWTDGIPGMKVGGRRLLGIPSELAYGPTGNPPDIAPDEPLWFVVEVLEVKPG